MEIKKYRVRIVENLKKIIEIEAESKEDALAQVKHAYNNEKYVLDYSNYESTDFSIEE
jgi:hypothetical protein